MAKLIVIIFFIYNIYSYKKGKINKGGRERGEGDRQTDEAMKQYKQKIKSIFSCIYT